MAAKKKTNPAPPEAESQPLREILPQPGQKTGRPGSESETNGINQAFTPEILADLTVKLVRLRMESPSSAASSRPQLASSAYDEVFADALKRAEALLLMAGGRSEDDIHAYQLFTETDGPMSFAEIAGRFSDFGWGGMKSQNTVRPVIENLIRGADLKVRKELDRMESLAGIRSMYPGGVLYLVDRVRRHIRTMITRTGLRDLFDDPKPVADAMGQFFFRLMRREIPGDRTRGLPEEYATHDSYASFIGHVCDGLSCGKFVGEPEITPLDSDSLGLLVHFLESCLGDQGSQNSEQAAQSLMKAKPDLDKLMRMIDGRNGIPQDAVENLANCLEEMQKAQPYSVRVVKFARQAAESLRATWEHWRLVQLTAVLGLDTLTLDLNRMLDTLGSEHVNVREKVGQLSELIDQVRKFGETCSRSADVGQMLGVFEPILEALRDGSVLLASTFPFDRKLKNRLDRVIKRLAEGLNPKLPGKRHIRAAMTKLFMEALPYDGERKCRPYEIFLFAAQNQLQSDKLVRRRSKLAAGMIPNPPYPYRALSIMESHGGSNLNRFIADLDP